VPDQESKWPLENMIVMWAMVLAVAALALVALGVYASRHRKTASASGFGLLMFAIAIWSLAYALELLSHALSTKM